MYNRKRTNTKILRTFQNACKHKFGFFFLQVFNKVIQYKQKYREIHEIGMEPVI